MPITFTYNQLEILHILCRFKDGELYAIDTRYRLSNANAPSSPPIDKALTLGLSDKGMGKGLSSGFKVGDSRGLALATLLNEIVATIREEEGL